MHFGPGQMIKVSGHRVNAVNPFCSLQADFKPLVITKSLREAWPNKERPAVASPQWGTTVRACHAEVTHRIQRGSLLDFNHTSY